MFAYFYVRECRRYRSSLVGAVGAAAAADSGTENARRHTNYLRSTSPFGSQSSLPVSSSVRSSADLTPLLRLRSASNSASKGGGSAADRGGKGTPQSEDEDRVSSSGVDDRHLSTQQSITLRRSWEQSGEDISGLYGSYDDMPMLSSLSQPLRKAGGDRGGGGVTTSAASLGSQGRRYNSIDRSLDDATPSFVSSLGDDSLRTHDASHAGVPGDISSSNPRLADSHRIPAFPQVDRNRTPHIAHHRSEDKSIDDDSILDTLSQSQGLTNVSTLTSVPDRFSLTRTIDSEGEMLARRSQVDVEEVRRHADAYEHAAHSRLDDSNSEEGEGEGISIMESPFKDYSRGGPGGMTALDTDTGSVNSLALSDSHNTLE